MQGRERNLHMETRLRPRRGGGWRQSFHTQWGNMNERQTPGRHRRAREGGPGQCWGKHTSAPTPTPTATAAEALLLLCDLTCSVDSQLGCWQAWERPQLETWIQRARGEELLPRPLAPRGTGVSTLRRSQRASQAEPGLRGKL